MVDGMFILRTVSLAITIRTFIARILTKSSSGADSLNNSVHQRFELFEGPFTNFIECKPKIDLLVRIFVWVAEDIPLESILVTETLRLKVSNGK